MHKLLICLRYKSLNYKWSVKTTLVLWFTLQYKHIHTFWKIICTIEFIYWNSVLYHTIIFIIIINKVITSLLTLVYYLSSLFMYLFLFKYKDSYLNLKFNQKSIYNNSVQLMTKRSHSTPIQCSKRSNFLS